MPEPISTEAQASAAGLATPQNLDLLAQGDDAILRNARFTKDALDAAAAAQAEAEVKADIDAALLPSADPDTVFAVVDEDGRRTWLEVAPDGGPTDRAAEKIGAPAYQDTTLTGLSFAVVDEDGRRTWLEADDAGAPTDHAVSALRDRLGAADPAPYADVVVCSGDSMTGGTGGFHYPTILAERTGWPVVNLGGGGETSVTIAGRVGGRPMLAAFPGGTIPADTSSVQITLKSDVEFTGGAIGPTKLRPLLQQRTGINPVTIAGVEGSFDLTDRATETYGFRRSVAGAAVPVSGHVPIITQAMRDYRNSIHVMWWGHNDALQDTGNTDVTEMIGRQQALIEHLQGPDKRWLVLGMATGGGTWRRGTDLRFLRAFGRRFISVGEYLSSMTAFNDAGLTPTQADLDQIAAGSIPGTWRTDTIHLTGTGYGLVARLVENRIKEMGWKN